MGVKRCVQSARERRYRGTSTATCVSSEASESRRFKWVPREFAYRAASCLCPVQTRRWQDVVTAIMVGSNKFLSAGVSSGTRTTETCTRLNDHWGWKRSASGHGLFDHGGSEFGAINAKAEKGWQNAVRHWHETRGRRTLTRFRHYANIYFSLRLYYCRILQAARHRASHSPHARSFPFD
jgi:hypothetical protein